jgi:dihydroxy-acid dehydratase
MASISADIPAIHVVTGSMLTGSWKGERLGACTDCRRLWAEYRAGGLNEVEIKEIEESLCATGGTCMVMGTASTMACILEILGLMLPGGATPPHAYGDRLKNCVASGRHVVELVKQDLTPGKILNRGSFENALKVLMAIGGSTNAIIHIIAMARRAGIKISLEDFNSASEQTPVLVDCKPIGTGYMEDFHHAGGVPVLLKEIESFLDLSTNTILAESLGDVLKEYPGPGQWQQTIRKRQNPLRSKGAITAVFGSLAPNGAVIKVAAAAEPMLKHKGPAIVFESPQDADERIDNPDLKITPQHVMILRNGGPVAAGMPEAGSLPIPKYLAAQGVKDMVRVSDARMSGTAYGTIVLHCSPESAVGGPIALVKDGDMIELDVAEKRIDLLVSDAELGKRRKSFNPPKMPERGWRKLHHQHVLQAHLGCDLDFL